VVDAALATAPGRISDPIEALKTLRELLEARETVAMVICDQKMPTMEGTELLSEVKSVCPDSIRVLLTGYSGMAAAITAINEHLLDKYLTKPIENEHDFLLSLQHLLQQFQMKQTIEKQNRTLAEANSRLEILDRLKTDFLGFISHELRTPLNHMSAVGLIDKNSSPSEQSEVIEIIRDGYQRLEGFVIKGLEYFNWLATERRFSEDVTDLHQAAQAAARLFPELSAPDTDFEISAPDGACLVRLDGPSLEQVIQILLDNAVRFSRAPRWIRLELERTPAAIVLRVRDRGVGFRPELGREILRPFTIASVSHHAEGSALNLARASIIVGTNGGRIRAESPGDGQGATFTAEFPLVVSGVPAAGGGEERLAA